MMKDCQLCFFALWLNARLAFLAAFGIWQQQPMVNVALARELKSNYANQSLAEAARRGQADQRDRHLREIRTA
jgi:hypothetical protein